MPDNRPKRILNDKDSLVLKNTADAPLETPFQEKSSHSTKDYLKQLRDQAILATYDALVDPSPEAEKKAEKLARKFERERDKAARHIKSSQSNQLIATWEDKTTRHRAKKGNHPASD